jgi:hypothetical protein
VGAGRADLCILDLAPTALEDELEAAPASDMRDEAAPRRQGTESYLEGALVNAGRNQHSASPRLP